MELTSRLRRQREQRKRRRARHRARRRPALGSIVAAGVLACVGLAWTGTTASLSSWTTAVVSNAPGTSGGGNAVATGSIAWTHAYQAGQATTCTAGPRVIVTTPCAGSLLPIAASATSPVTSTVAETNNGTLKDAQVTRTISGASCAPEELLDRTNATNPMLPRYATSFQTAGPFGAGSALTLNGTNGYAASIVSQTLHGGTLLANTAYGVGVYFKAASGQSGPLFEFGSSPTNVAGTDDRILYLTASGTLTFLHGNGLGGKPKTTTTRTYADGAWHFAYVRVATTAGLVTSTTITVDGTLAATENPSSYASPTGYWHLGWAPTATTGLSTAYFGGSLSNFVVFETSPAPVAPSSNATTQDVFTQWAIAGGATDHWILNDTGTQTFTGTQPSIGTTSPCTMLNLTWSGTNPSATPVTGVALSTFANGTNTYPVGSDPGPGVTQTDTVSIARGSSYNAYIAGLRLYVPITQQVTTASGKWPLTFTWTGVDSVFYG